MMMRGKRGEWRCSDPPAGAQTEQERIPTPEERKELARKLRAEVEAYFGWNLSRPQDMPPARRPKPDPSSEEALMERANKMRRDLEARFGRELPRG